MADPIIWTIQQNVFAALDAIDGTGDYFTNPTVRYRSQGVNESVAGDLVTLWPESAERLTDRDHNGIVRWAQEFVASGSTDVTGDSIYERLHKLRSDMEAAIMSDPQWTVAEETALTGTEYIANDDARIFVQSRFVIKYKTSEGNPTTQT